MKRPTILTVLGILAIVFGSLGVLANCCGVANLGLMGAVRGFTAKVQQQIDAQQETRRQQYEDDLAAATDEAERAQVEKNYQDWRQKNPRLDMEAMYAWTKDARFIGHVVADGVLSFIANALLIAAGVGLLKMRPGARTLGIVTAATKIGINLGTGLYSLLVLIPLQQESMRPMMDQLESIQKNNPGPSMGPSMDLQQTLGKVGAVIGILTSCAFPVILLILLNLKSVRSALTSSSPQPGT